MKYFGGGGASGGLKALYDEDDNAVITHNKLRVEWLRAFDNGVEGVVTNHIKLPRLRVRAATAANQNTSTISRTFDGLAGPNILQLNDLLYFGGQNTASQNGVYRVWSISGANCFIVKQSLIDVYLIPGEAGLYVQVAQGNTAGGQIWKFRAGGNGSFANGGQQMPDISPSILNFVDVEIDDFFTANDNISPTTGDWQPVIERAEQFQVYAPGTIGFFDNQTYRISHRVNRASLAIFAGFGRWESTAQIINGARILFDGCGGFFGPVANETYDGVTYDSGWRAGVNLERLNCVFVNGTTDMHYGALIHGASNIDTCNFDSPFGNGIEYNTADIVGGIGNNNGDTLYRTLINNCGLNGWFIRGGDSNNISIRDSRSTGHGTRGLTAIEYSASGLPSLTPANNPALTLNSSLRYNNTTSQTITPTISGQLSWGPTLVPRIVVEINSTAGGTGLGQAFFRVSYDGGTTWGLAGAGGQVTAAGPIALDGAATGMFLSFPAGVYSAAMAWHGSIFPGNDWGIRNQSFLGLKVENSEFSSGHLGGVYDQGTFTVYDKVYTEGGTVSDVVTSTVIGGNLVLRTGGNATRLPNLKCLSDNSYSSSGITCSDGSFIADIGVGSDLFTFGRQSDTELYHIRIGTGGNTNLLVQLFATTSVSSGHFWTLSGHSLGVNCEGFLRGVFITVSMRVHRIARTSLPTTGVPITGGAGSATDGPYPVSSIAWEPNPGSAALLYQVSANSGSAAFNLTWRSVANPSPSPVTLTDANASIKVTDGGLRRLAAGILTDARAVTLDATNAKDGDKIEFEIEAQGFNYTIDGKVIPAGSRAFGYSRYEAGFTTWIAVSL